MLRLTSNCLNCLNATSSASAVLPINQNCLKRSDQLVWKIYATTTCYFSVTTRCTNKYQDQEFTPKRRKLRNYVSHFIDSLRIHVKGGSGGGGIPHKGGCGGRGGDVIAVGKKEITLKDVLKRNPAKRISAETGQDSRFFSLIGEPGKPTKFDVPVGITIISEQGYKMGEINEEDESIVVARGGDGGAPNTGFCATKGDAHSITLDLKLIADVGFVGFPNAGKSTLLRAMSRAKPKIASYPFTTIRPNVGVIEFPDLRRISLADLPGLIEGAHLNHGLGHRFLKHVERTKILLFIVDIHGFQLAPKYPVRTALETIILLNRELELYQSDLCERPAILALNKFDLPDSYPIIENVRETYKSTESLHKYITTLPEEMRPSLPIKFQKIVPISAKTDNESVNILKESLRTLIDVNEDLKRAQVEEHMRKIEHQSS